MGTVIFDPKGHALKNLNKEGATAMKIGYVRASTEEQKTIRQEIIMEQLGVEKVYIEKISGKNTERPQLQKMMSFIREGDVLIVESISRFARSTRDLLDLVEQLKRKGVQFISQKESIDTESPQGKFMLTVFAAMAELERDQMLQRQREGIEAAKKAGKYTGRQPIKIEPAVLKAVHKQWYNNEITTAHAVKLLGVSKNTFYRKMWEYEDEVGMPRKRKGK